MVLFIFLTEMTKIQNGKVFTVLISHDVGIGLARSMVVCLSVSFGLKAWDHNSVPLPVLFRVLVNANRHLGHAETSLLPEEMEALTTLSEML